MAKDYAQALYKATRGKTTEEVDSILQNLFRILKEKGHERLLTSITRELEKIVKRKGNEQELLIRVCATDDVEKFSTRITRDLETLKAETLPRRVVVDETLVGGYELRALGTRIDRTYKRTLLALYNNLITN